ncbi:MAG: acyl-ACP--UDP-N-acetylglucosamine O-acyltransferase [Chitinophagaceae bacterium]
MIHQYTHIDPNAKIGKNVTIEAFTSVYGDVEIGDGTWIGPNVTIMSGARIGINCKIFPGAVIAGIPQDLKFKGEHSLAIIGDNTTIREYVTVHRGTAFSNKTQVGSNCLIMGYCHVAHDCIIGDNCIMSSNVQLAGHVIIENNAIIGGFSGIHQFVRIGSHTFVSAGSFIGKDIPPYIRTSFPAFYAGVNSVGLKRQGRSTEKINHILDIYRCIYNKDLNITQALECIEQEIPNSEERHYIVQFIKTSKRGIIKKRGDNAEDTIGES